MRSFIQLEGMQEMFADAGLLRCRSLAKYSFIRSPFSVVQFHDVLSAGSSAGRIPSTTKARARIYSQHGCQCHGLVLAGQVGSAVLRVDEDFGRSAKVEH